VNCEDTTKFKKELLHMWDEKKSDDLSYTDENLMSTGM
jgi:hypothetical protein